MTVEQLAWATGMTVRTIRAHQSRGLVPPPEVRSGTGHYGPDHVARLKLIKEMQADGFNLKAIEHLIEGAGAASEEVLGFKRALTMPFESEEPQLFTAHELVERFGDDAANQKTVARAESLGLLRALDDGRYEAPSPLLLGVAEKAMRSGVSLPAALSVVAQVKRNCEVIADRFVDLFLEEVWKPFEEAGYPEQEWAEVIGAIEGLRPLASEAVVAVFQQTMTRAVEGAFGKALEHGRKGRRRSNRS